MSKKKTVVELTFWPVVIRILLMSLLFAVYFFVHRNFIVTHFALHLGVTDGFLVLAPSILMVFFMLMYWDRLEKFNRYETKLSIRLGFFAVSIFFLFFPFSFWYHLSVPSVAFLKESITQGLAKFFLFLAIFGWKFFQEFKKQILMMLLLIMTFVLSPVALDTLWEPASRLTILSFEIISKVLGITYTIGPQPYTISVENFRVLIGSGCAGINSFLAFISLFLAYILMLKDRGMKLIHPGVEIAFILGGITIFLLNGLRIASILYIGANYSQEFAINTFHSYIGSVLLMLFIFVYFKIAHPFITEKRT